MAINYTSKKRKYNWGQSLCFKGKYFCALHHNTNCGCAKCDRTFRRFIDDIIRIVALETSCEHIQQVLTSVFSHSGLEQTFRYTGAAEQMGEVVFLDVNHRITTEDGFGLVAKDFEKPTAEGC